jgi:HD-GYP domain-containing protein (c-di-GMP phosphodiesterase class II)
VRFHSIEGFDGLSSTRQSDICPMETAERTRAVWLPDLGARARADADGDSLVEASRARIAKRLEQRDRLGSLTIGGLFLATAVALALIPSDRPFDPLLAVGLVVAFAVAARVEFEVGTGTALATQLALVPMLFLLPPGVVPLAVAASLACSHLFPVPRRAELGRVPLDLVNSWFAVGPAAVLVLAGEPGPDLALWPIFAGALLAQFALDFTSAAAREWIALGFSPREHLRYMGWVWLVDSSLAPVALLLAAGAVDQPYAFVLGMPLVGLLAVFARERRARIDGALELSHAYRGTAFLLGDVVEADDAYTGSHSRDVVDLVLDVSERLGLDARHRRHAEFTALLHDVGKIRIPGEIINKPGALDDEEWAVMRTHTVEGQEMLERVGGLLGEVGRLVRSCHERWDGKGYPDGLAGVAIPLVARIVCCCDAYSAMTTERPYRAARPVSEAVAELERCAGTQFDPDVVEALVESVTSPR